MPARSSWSAGRKDPKEQSVYRVAINRNHPPATRFATIAHELAHLFLGHLGQDKTIGAPSRSTPDQALREVEAESVAYIVCKRNGVEPKSEKYLKDYVKVAREVDVYAVMKAAGQIEQLLNLAGTTKFDTPPKSRASQTIAS
jgi:antirestriction protein ArdC